MPPPPFPTRPVAIPPPGRPNLCRPPHDEPVPPPRTATAPTGQPVARSVAVSPVGGPNPVPAGWRRDRPGGRRRRRRRDPIDLTIIAACAAVIALRPHPPAIPEAITAPSTVGSSLKITHGDTEAIANTRTR